LVQKMLMTMMGSVVFFFYFFILREFQFSSPSKGDGAALSP
jgi:hypothetical protein